MINMKKYIFLAILFAVHAVFAAEVSSTIDSVIIPEGELKLIQEERITTNNGLMISLGKVSNGLDFAVLAKNMTFGGDTIGLDIIIHPNSTWTYARLDGMLIVPKTPAIIDTSVTSFYPTSRQLHVSVDGTDEMDVYFKSATAPQIVLSDSNINWRFSNNRLNIKSPDIMRDVDVYWTDGSEDIVIVPDRRKAESIEYRISKLMEDLPKMNEILIKLRSKNEELRQNVLSLEARIKSLGSERDSLKNALAQTNRTSQQIESRISANVAVGQSVFALAVIISIISMMVLVDTIVPRKKGEVK